MTNEEGSAEVGRDNVEISPLGKETLKDYYLSFKFSQGSIELQNLLLLYTAKLHSLEEIHEIVSQSELLKKNVEKMRTPKAHTKFYQKNQPLVMGSFSDIFNGYIILLTEIVNGNPKQNPSNSTDIDMTAFYQAEEEILEGEIAIRIANQDRFYLENINYLGERGRPQREKTGSDPFESYLKTYAIDMTPIGSIAYGKLFQNIHSLLLITNKMDSVSVTDKKKELPFGPLDKETMKNILADRIHNLNSAWEEKHPGQRFFSSDLSDQR